MTDDLCQSVLVYRSPLRKLDTSSNQLCASLDKACAAGKLLSFRLAGTAGRCGQSTLCIGGLLAHPLRERQKFCVHGIIGARQTGASNEHEHQTQFS